MSTYSDDVAATSVPEWLMQVMDGHVADVCSFIKHVCGEVTSAQQEDVKRLVYSEPDVWKSKKIHVPEPLDMYLKVLVSQHLRALVSKDPQKAKKLINELRFNELLTTWIGECKNLVECVRGLYWDLTSPAPSS